VPLRSKDVSGGSTSRRGLKDGPTIGVSLGFGSDTWHAYCGCTHDGCCGLSAFLKMDSSEARALANEVQGVCLRVMHTSLWGRACRRRLTRRGMRRTVTPPRTAAPETDSRDALASDGDGRRTAEAPHQLRRDGGKAGERPRTFISAAVPSSLVSVAVAPSRVPS